MEHKPIYLDGVDVSGCEDFREGYCYPDTGVCYKCDTNCQYAALYLKEQLARKTQECEELKEKLEKFYTLAGEPIEYFLDHYTNLCEDFLLDDRDEDDNTIPILEQIRDRLEDKDTLEEENTRYRKALEEIEKYTKKSFCENCEDFNTPEYSSHCEFCEYQEYFDIINKAKGEGICQ